MRCSAYGGQLESIVGILVALTSIDIAAVVFHKLTANIGLLNAICRTPFIDNFIRIILKLRVRNKRMDFS